MFFLAFKNARLCRLSPLVAGDSIGVSFFLSGYPLSPMDQPFTIGISPDTIRRLISDCLHINAS